ncbi:DUF4349 domain-containing protein [Microbacterium hominis]|uniref:DUF4349 domain-containing protein n=1 Tax=Microbacterium hominis TaxID=162426 RepID=A0A7D4TFB3_9MICO|nr:DUF4349 domain-containing protein [Microbacterium hominis]QKJ19240.1 DUF4349 domain-containing protein [Microbacterium hominis]
MNTSSSTQTRDLPELAASRIDEIERELFDGIARERGARERQRARRGRIWIGGAAAAAVLIVAAVIAPSVGTLVSGGSAADTAASPELLPGIAVEESARDGALSSGDTATGGAVASAQDEGAREIIANASAQLTVDDVADAARGIGEEAARLGGYVESMNIDITAQGAGSSGAEPGVGPDGLVVVDTFPFPQGAWVSVRVPSDSLPEMIEGLDEFGEVTASSISRQDVTEQTVDLRARIEVAQASVDRLTALMAEAASVSDVIAAESALAERQATLESYQQQLESLESQIDLSGLTVTLTRETVPVEADPAGFADGLAAGWNGLVATLNGIVIALGFLLPWLFVAGAAALIVWGVLRLRRRRRASVDVEP